MLNIRYITCEGAGPGLQPPGHHLRTVVAKPVASHRVTATVWHGFPFMDKVQTVPGGSTAADVLLYLHQDPLSALVNIHPFNNI